MLRRSVLFAILVIILVSLNWFKSLLAQDLSSLSEEQKQQLLQKYRSNQPAKEDQKVYVSPDFRPDDHPSETIGLYPADSAQALSAHREALTTNEVTAATGKSPLDGLRPFGLELFEGGADVVSPPDIASAENYILGPGDNIIVYLWGRVDREYRLALDREGKVFIPRAGEIIGWGLSLKQFTDRVRTRLSKVYSQFDLTVSLGKIRSIRIYVTGEVRRPGAYTVSSLTSLFNAIYLAGGPNERGSMRRIKLMRNGTCIETVDLYRFLLEGDNSTDVRLRTGDALFIPVAASRVAVAGEVRRPALYELLGTESALDVLTLAGGPTAEAHLERAMLERISSESEWEVLDLNLKTGDSAGAGTLTLQDGDRLTVYSIFEQRKHMVAVFGHVQHSGYYERNDSTRVSDLIERGKLRSYDVYLERADLFRRHVDDRVEVIPVSLQAISDGDRGADFVLRDRDSLHIYSINEVKWDRHVYIEGEVRQPGEYPLYEQMTVADLIFLSGSYTRSANRLQAEIARLDSDGEVTLLYLELNDSASLLMPLVEDDHLFIRRIPLWKSDRVVSVTGEIMYPGSYTLSSTENTLYQIIQRAGGFTPQAFPTGLVLERKSIGESLTRMQIPALIDRSQPIVQDTLGRPVRQNLFDYDQNSVSRVIIDMKTLVSTHGKNGDLILEPGDQIFVPSIPSGITVMGAVGANGTLKYVGGKDVRYYVKRAGNFTQQADKKATRLVRADGEVISQNGVLKSKVALGDVIIVPSKIRKERNLFKAITTGLSAVTGVLTSVYIVARL